MSSDLVSGRWAEPASAFQLSQASRKLARTGPAVRQAGHRTRLHPSFNLSTSPSGAKSPKIRLSPQAAQGFRIRRICTARLQCPTGEPDSERFAKDELAGGP